MIKQFLFQHLSTVRQIQQLKDKGAPLGTRSKKGRKVYVYMLGDMFVEVTYLGDHSENAAEDVTVLRGLKTLADYLETEFRTSFGLSAQH